MSFSARTFRDALGTFATGVTVITIPSAGQDEAEGLTVNSFTSVSLDPPLILWCLNRGSEGFERFARAQTFGVSVLNEGQEAIARYFAQTGRRGLKSVPHQLLKSGTSVIEDALARLDCAVERAVEGGDHIIFLCRVVHLDLRKDGAPLLYFRGGFTGLGGN